MRLRKFLCAALIALFSIQMLHVTALADEGMWPFNNVPRAEIKRKYGFDVTDAWLKKVQMSAVRFNNGGSGSFVSPTGLVLTNYHFPRFNIDMALVRVYEDGQPIKPENYLKWSTKGTKDGELVFVAGHPGSTSRLNTVAHLEELRDVSLPLILRYL